MRKSEFLRHAYDISVKRGTPVPFRLLRRICREHRDNQCVVHHFFDYWGVTIRKTTVMPTVTA